MNDENRDLTEEEADELLDSLEFSLGIPGYTPPTMADAPRMVIYARVSTLKQEDTSIQQQVRDAKRKIAEENGKLVGIYFEKGSGTKMDEEHRPKFMQMMREHHKWDTVVVAKLDRLHRNLRNLHKWTDELRRRNKHFIAVDFQIDTSSPMGKVMLTMMITFAEWEADMARERTISGMKGRRNIGVKIGRPPYGYRSRFKTTQQKADRGYLDIIPEEADIVKNIIFPLKDEGITAKEASERLNDADVPTKTEGKKWIKSTVQAIWDNEYFYRGMFRDSNGEVKDLSAGEEKRWEAIL